jgi:hypothetical protein
MIDRRRLVLGGAALLALLVALVVQRAPRAAADLLPLRLSDKAFWQIVTDFSEPNGYFRSDNFLSNERGYQRVIPELQATVPPAGVYLGVGPEQNFTYLSALHPKLAFIVDIRRGNLHEHLLYKALIEMSTDRADFLSKLFSRPRPVDLDPNATVDDLFAAYRGVMPSEPLFDRNLQAVRDWLMKRHGFALSGDDVKGLEYVYNAFYEGGPELNYTFMSGQAGNSRGAFGFGGFGGPFPTYAELMTETDGQGRQRSYLASAESFRTLSELEKNNAVIPIVGDFAGPKALRSIGRYLHDRSATVTTVYTSNVEMYLFQSDAWTRYYANLEAVPVDAKSTFIRSVSNRGFRSGGPYGMRATTRLCSIADLLRAFQTGKVEGYYDVIAMSH